MLSPTNALSISGNCIIIHPTAQDQNSWDLLGSSLSIILTFNWSVSLINPTSSWDSISLPQFLPYLTWPTWIALKIHFKAYFRDFLGGPVVKTPHFHWKGCGFVPWSKKIQHAPCMAKEKGIFHFASISSWPLWQFSYSRAHSVQFSSVQSPSRVQLFVTPI